MGGGGGGRVRVNCVSVLQLVSRHVIEIHMIQEIGFTTSESDWSSSDSSWQCYYMLGTTTKLSVPFQVLVVVTLERNILHCFSLL